MLATDGERLGGGIIISYSVIFFIYRRLSGIHRTVIFIPIISFLILGLARGGVKLKSLALPDKFVENSV
jgi:hypothetical protein